MRPNVVLWSYIHMIVVTIAHRAGNNRSLLRDALAADVDALEVDLRLDGGRLVARHERRFPFLPLYHDHWRWRLRFGRQITLEELLENVGGRAALLLDLKSTSVPALRQLVKVVRAHGGLAGHRASTNYWHLLRLLKQSAPELKLYYSIGNPQELARFWEMQESTHEAKGVSIKQTLLDGILIDRFRHEEVEVLAYSVYDLERARRLAEWGVAGIISGNLATLSALKSVSPLT